MFALLLLTSIDHICLVSELLGMCVYDFLKKNNFAPFPRHHIQKFACQLLGNVACKFDIFKCPSPSSHAPCFVLHELKLIHTDLKPENVQLVRNDYHVPVLGKVVMCVVNISNDGVGQRNAPPKAKRILESTDIRQIDFGTSTTTRNNLTGIPPPQPPLLTRNARRRVSRPPLLPVSVVNSW